MSLTTVAPRSRTARLRTVPVVALVAMLAAAAPVATFRDGPPAAVTGGFGEDSCLACHFDNGLNEPGGSLALAGLPQHFTPGETYTLNVTLTRPGLKVGGFQLSARAASGSQAGTLVVVSSESDRVSVQEHRAVQYIQHLLGGITPVKPDTASWTIEWTAPESAETVSFNAAAVAGDNDESQVGDFVYTLERQLPSESRR